MYVHPGAATTANDTTVTTVSSLHGKPATLELHLQCIEFIIMSENSHYNITMYVHVFALQNLYQPLVW